MRKLITLILLLILYVQVRSQSPVYGDLYVYGAINSEGDSIVGKQFAFYNLTTFPTCPSGRKCLAYVNDTLRENTTGTWVIFMKDSFINIRNFIRNSTLGTRNGIVKEDSLIKLGYSDNIGYFNTVDLRGDTPGYFSITDSVTGGDVYQLYISKDDLVINSKGVGLQAITSSDTSVSINTGNGIIKFKNNNIYQSDANYPPDSTRYLTRYETSNLIYLGIQAKQNLTDTTTYDATKNDVAIERNAKNDSILAIRNLANNKYSSQDTSLTLSTIHGTVDSIRYIVHDTAQILRSEFQRSLIDTIIYAGTSPDGYILRSSDNGLTWSNLGSAGKGQPLAFCQLSNGDLLYTTDQGYVVNHTKGTNVFIDSYPIYAIAQLSGGIYSGNIFIGRDDKLYVSYDNGTSFEQASTGWGKPIYFINKENGGMPIVTGQGIYIGGASRVQIGSFTSALQIPNTDTIYALTYAGNVFRSINAGTNWTDLGDQGAANSRFITKGLGSRIIIGYGSTVMIYSDNGFSTIGYLSSQEPEAKCLITTGSRMIIGQSDTEGSGGKISYSDNNGVAFTDLGQQYSQDSINCLIAVTGSTYVQPGDLSVYETKVQHNTDTTLQRAWMDGLEERKVNISDTINRNPGSYITPTQAANIYLAKVDTNHFVNEKDTIAASKLIETHTALMSDSVGKSGNAGGVIMTWMRTFILNRLASHDTIYKVITREKLRVIWMDSTEIDSIENLRNVDMEGNGIACTNYAPTSTSVKNIGRSINTDTVIIKKGKPLIFRNSTLNTNTAGDIRLWTDTDTTKISRWNGTTWVNLLKLNSSGDLTLTGDLKYRYTHASASGDSISTTYTLTRTVYQKMTSLSLTPHDTDGIKIQGDSIQIWKHEGDFWMTPIIAGNGANANDRIQIKVFINNVASATSLGRYIIAGNGLPQDYHYYLKDIPKGAWISFHITNLTASRNFTLTDFKVLISKAPEQ